MRDCECTVPRVPGDATRRLNDHISARLEPYDLEKALTFSPEYLSGFYTDRYDVPPLPPIVPDGSLGIIFTAPLLLNEFR